MSWMLPLDGAGRGGSRRGGSTARSGCVVCSNDLPKEVPPSSDAPPRTDFWLNFE